ncbi:muscarinic acetylcholine receptor M2-like [Coregonus clupeaformis]|uniref:muscarinic acetylcholine receptor M2-like n=1 Tax=Coregonus clupeaformis TaxID=59861 RepID=UPI001BE10830|nr:muscarinic acetylcholine receptor M2-like [Coregonus clupeaformis]
MEMLNFTNYSNLSSDNGSSSLFSRSPYKTVEIVLIILVAGSLSLVTIIGNILVMLSIKVNRNLQTVNNYFLFSLACADLIIGLCSMNLYTVYIVIGHWPLGPVMCDLWLAIDYVVSNASVMNLLIISFDRYFCITKPLSYPVRRSTTMAGMMIAAAWVLSFVLWAPAILFWQFIVGGRTVPPGECYIQFFSNATVTFGTAIAAFYLPVAIMISLYWRISRASRSRVRRNSRKPSGNSLGEGPSQSQEDGFRAQPNDCTVTGEEEEEEGGDGEKAGEGVQQKNGREPCRGYGPDKDSSTTTSNQREEPGLSQKGSNGEAKPSQTRCCSQNQATCCGPKLSCIRSNPWPEGETYTATHSNTDSTPATEKHSLVTRTLLKVTKRNSKQSSKRKTKKRKGPPSREKKVTRTIMAILVAFVATWTPYNVMVLINTFYSSCIPNSLWTFGYWLCYINSTVNPACYALCNTTFKNTFRQLLLCQYRNIRTMRS